jgi:hypothetical protein
MNIFSHPRRLDSPTLVYTRLRRATGRLALLLPLSLLLLSALPQVPFAGSISLFYYGPAGVILPLIIGPISMFLCCYQGSEPDPERVRRNPKEAWLTDRNLSLVAALSVWGVALTPTNPPAGMSHSASALMHMLLKSRDLISLFHGVLAAVFFFCLVVFCLSNFQRSPHGGPQPARCAVTRSKFRIYSVCGWMILSMTLVFLALSIARNSSAGASEWITGWRLIFWSEAVALTAFSIAWQVKGDGLLPLVHLVRSLTAVPGPLPAKRNNTAGANALLPPA